MACERGRGSRVQNGRVEHREAFSSPRNRTISVRAKLLQRCRDREQPVKGYGSVARLSFGSDWAGKKDKDAKARGWMGRGPRIDTKAV